MGLETRGASPGGTEHREAARQKRALTEAFPPATGDRPVVVVRRPRTSQERAAIREAHMAKIGRIAGLMHDYRVAQSPTDTETRAMIARAEKDEEYRADLMQRDWHQAEAMVGGEGGDTSRIESRYQELIERAKTRTASVLRIAHALYERRILTNYGERDLSPEEASKRQEQDWDQALQLLDEIKDPTVAVSRAENVVARIKKEKTIRALVMVGKVLASSK